MGRRYRLTPDREDVSDVTGKFAMIGLGNSRAAPDRLGAGTPDFEWRFRIAVAPSHDEQKQGGFERGQTTATGTGRFENFALLVRLPLGARDSLEIAGNRKNHDATDLVNLGGEKFTLGEERTLGADRIDVALGWRHRWKDFEGSASAVYVQADGSNGTAGAFHQSGGGLFGAAIEGRARHESWFLSLSAQRVSGSVPVGEQSAPAFNERDFSANATLESYRIGAGRSGKRIEVFVSAAYDRSVLPFVAFAVLGTETVAFEQGFHPNSAARQFIVDLTVRGVVNPSIRPRVFLRWARGNETLTLSDSSGLLPTQTLGIRRAAGVFGHNEPLFGDVVIGLGAEVAPVPGR